MGSLARKVAAPRFSYLKPQRSACVQARSWQGTHGSPRIVRIGRNGSRKMPFGAKHARADAAAVASSIAGAKPGALVS
jgi:hypothetical protein